MFYKLKLHKSNLIRIKSPRFMEETAQEMSFQIFVTFRNLLEGHQLF